MHHPVPTLPRLLLEHLSVSREYLHGHHRHPLLPPVPVQKGLVPDVGRGKGPYLACLHLQVGLPRQYLLGRRADRLLLDFIRRTRIHQRSHPAGHPQRSPIQVRGVDSLAYIRFQNELQDPLSKVAALLVRTRVLVLLDR
jgi:hypothetical protein